MNNLKIIKEAAAFAKEHLDNRTYSTEKDLGILLDLSARCTVYIKQLTAMEGQIVFENDEYVNGYFTHRNLRTLHTLLEPYVLKSLDTERVTK